MSSLLLYGSYGYVGHLIAEEAIERGLDVTLAGRDRQQLASQVEDLDRSGLRFDLSDPETVAAAVEEFDCVLNCAGPYSNTAEAMVEGCLRAGTDYVDYTGEVPVIERLRARDVEAVDAGVTLLPSAGFSSIPMDCLAAHLAGRLPDADRLLLGVDSFRIPSGGTLKTAVEGADTGGAIRRNGHLERVPDAWRTSYIDFGRGARRAVTMPLGDVSTTHYTTGIPDVEVYAYVPRPASAALRAYRYLAPIAGTAPVQWVLERVAGLVRDGPSERARRRGDVYVWGEARAGDQRAVSRLRTPDAYVVTVQGALNAAERVMAGDASAGYQTPAGAFGEDFVFEIGDVDGYYDEPVSSGVRRTVTTP